LLALVGVVVAQLFFTYLPAMNRLFDTAPLRLEHWLILCGLGAGTFVLLEIEKWAMRRLGPFKELA
jgi:magnesium-transporting ATPase (P-type)